MVEKVEYIENSFIFKCPYCRLYVQVLENETNCKIFRHGIFKSSGLQIPPHSSENKCKEFLINNLVYGCCKPFRLVIGENGFIEFVEKCDYI